MRLLERLFQSIILGFISPLVRSVVKDLHCNPQHYETVLKAELAEKLSVRPQDLELRIDGIPYVASSVVLTSSQQQKVDRFLDRFSDVRTNTPPQPGIQ